MQFWKYSRSLWVKRARARELCIYQDNITYRKSLSIESEGAMSPLILIRLIQKDCRTVVGEQDEDEVIYMEHFRLGHCNMRISLGGYSRALNVRKSKVRRRVVSHI